MMTPVRQPALPAHRHIGHHSRLCRPSATRPAGAACRVSSHPSVAAHQAEEHQEDALVESCSEEAPLNRGSTQKQRLAKRAAARLLQGTGTARGSSVTAAAFKARAPGSGSLSTSFNTSTSGAGSSAQSLVGANPQIAGGPSPHIGAGSQHRHRALVLDASYRPINVVNWYRAVQLDVDARCEVLDYYPPPAFAVSGRGEHPMPAVLRLSTSVNLKELITRAACTRRNIMVRDRFTCQYCGVRHDLTLDHLVPVSKGGKDTWTNLVTACTTCNQKKGNHMLESLKGWKLKNLPKEPKPWELGLVAGLSTGDLFHAHETWEPWIQHYRNWHSQIRRDMKAAGVRDTEDELDDSRN